MWLELKDVERKKLGQKENIWVLGGWSEWYRKGFEVITFRRYEALKRAH